MPQNHGPISSVKPAGGPCSAGLAECCFAITIAIVGVVLDHAVVRTTRPSNLWYVAKAPTALNWVGGQEVTLGRPQMTVTKRQREQKKRERQQMKAERRAQRKVQGSSENADESANPDSEAISDSPDAVSSQ